MSARAFVYKLEYPSTLQLENPGLILQSNHTKSFSKVGIYSFSARRSALKKALSQQVSLVFYVILMDMAVHRIRLPFQ